MASSSARLDDIFQNAVISFEAALTEKQRREFQSCSLKDVEDTIRGIESRLASQRKQRNMRRIAKFVEGMSQLGKVIEVFVNCDVTVAFVWGPIKFVLLFMSLSQIKVAGTWVETLDCLLDTYAEIGEFLPGLSQYERLLVKHPALGTYLQKYYCDILEFHRKALSVFSRPSWKTAFHSSWKTFKTQFGPILTKLKRHQHLLSDERIGAAIAQVEDSVQSVADTLDDLSRQVQRLHLDNDEDKALRHREDLHRKRQFVLSKLDPPNYASDLEKAVNERAKSTSGHWLLTDSEFRQWVDVATGGRRALYLSGIPGTGKTILASRVVEYLHEMREKSPSPSVLYFFFKHHQPDKRTFSAMLLSFLSQVALQDEVVLDIVYQRFVSADQQKIRAVSLLREVADLALRAQGYCFVVVDGLDECVHSYAKPEDAQGEVIDWLETLMATSDTSSAHAGSGEPDDRCMRLLISGQRNGYLEKRLEPWPTIQIDSSSAHMHDIEAYSAAKGIEIQKRFGIDEATRLDIISKVNGRALGMFLYAKVVLDNLLRQPTRGHFKRELKEENFPKGMDQAYERVAVQVLDDPDDQRTGSARQILDLVICAERPLLWKEIQSRLCIDVQSETADPDFRLLEGCKQYCGSLVELGQNDEGVSAPDEVVELVHETARAYLLQTGRFRLADLHAEMALFCTQYLCSVPFNHEKSRFDIERHCLTGYYGFLDYAAANWWKHVKRLPAPLDQTTIEALSKLSNRLGVEGETTGSDIAAIQTQIQHLGDDCRDWEDAFPTENRIRPIRNCIETVLSSPGTQNLDDLDELYGRLRYKCTKPWCHFFLLGFQTASLRQDHISQHERPFRCDVQGCYGYQIGFSKEPDLARHNSRVHIQPEITSLDFPPRPNNARIGRDIFEAAAKGKLGVISALVELGTNVNARNKDGTTPLFFAAKAGHYQVCRWLLEHGAKVNVRCTKSRTTPLHAAVANDDVDIVSLLISGHGADIYARNKYGDSMMTLMEKKRTSKVSAAFPLEYWDHKECTETECRAGFHRNSGNEPGRIRNQEYFILAIRQNDTNTVQGLLSGPDMVCLDPGLDVKYFGDFDVLSVREAVAESNNEVREPNDSVFQLLNTGRIDFDEPDSQGNLALHMACASAHPTLTRILFAFTSFHNARNHNGHTPFELLVSSSEVDGEHGLQRRAALVSAILESRLVDVNDPDDESGRMPLHRACIVSDPPIVELLLAHSPIVGPEDRMGVTPYQLAVARGYLPVITALLHHKRTCASHNGGGPLTTREQSCVHVMTLINRLDPSMSTRSHVRSINVSPLQFGAYHLDIPIIQAAITLRDGTDYRQVFVRQPQSEWSSGLAFSARTWGTYLATPLFVAMNRALYKQHRGEVVSARDHYRELFDALLSIPSLDLGLSTRPTAKYDPDQRAKIRLIDACCDDEMVRRMARAGLSLPWELLRLTKDNRIHVAGGPAGAGGSYLENNHTVLAVLRSGHCRFVDIIRQNFEFARDVLASGCIEPVFLNLDGLTTADIIQAVRTDPVFAKDMLASGFVERGSLNLENQDQLLASLFCGDWSASIGMLKDLIRLGFDGKAALLQSAEAGLESQVALLLRAEDEGILDAAAKAHDIAVEKGFQEIAEMLVGLGTPN